jgi:hypothetical protein
MAEVTNELIYEVLKLMQERIGRLDGKIASVHGELRDIKSELQAIRGHMLATQQDITSIYGRLGQHGDQLDRINRRLDLVDA